MATKAKILLPLLLLILLPSTLKSQEYHFVPLPSSQLPTDEVAALVQDSRGFMWIVGYNGLVRFDSYSLVPYPSREDFDEYFEGYLHTASADGELLYVGSERGLFTLNTQSGELSKIKDSGLEELNVSDVTIAPDGSVWVGGDKGIFRKGKDATAFEKMHITEGNSPLTDIIDLLFDTEGNLWITCWEKGLYRYNLQTSRLNSYTQRDLKVAYVLHQDSNGTLWVGTWGRGLLALDPSDPLSYTRYNHIAGSSTSILDDIIYTINEDTQGNIWIGSRNGLSIFDGTSFTNIYPDASIGGLPFNEVNAILRTYDGTMWLGMLGGGVCKAEAKQSSQPTLNLDAVRTEYNTNSVRSILSQGGNEYWMGIAGHGMIHYNDSTGIFRNSADMPQFSGLPHSSTFDAIITRSSTGEICFGSYETGLWIYNPVKDSTKVISSSSSKLGDNCIRALAEDPSGNIWIGTRNGVFILDSADEVHRLGEWLGTKGQVIGCKIMDIAAASNGDIWMATNYDGIIRVSQDRKKISYYTIKDNSEIKGFNSIFIDSSGRIWAGSMWDGVYFFDADKDEFRREDDFAFLQNKAVTNIAEGPKGRIWISTTDNIISFRYGNDGFTNFSFSNISSSGTSAFFNKNASAYLADSREMAFGTSRGVAVFPDSTGCADTHIHNVVITDFRANGREVSRPVVLRHNENNIEISFSMLDFNDAQGDIYRYRLTRKGIGSTNPWSIVNGDGHKAVFHNLKSGKYIFEVSGARSGGSQASDVSVCKFKIRHHPWLAWWMVLAYIAILTTALLYIERAILRKKRRLVVEMKDIDYTSDDKNFVQKAIEVVNNHISDDNFYLEDFCREMGVSRTILTNRLKELTGFTPTGFVLNARLSLAYKIISEGKEKMRVSDLAYAVGFSDAKYFSKKFKARYGKTPKEMMTNK